VNETYEVLSVAKSKTDSLEVMAGLVDSLLPSIKTPVPTITILSIPATLHDIAILMNISKSQLIQQIIATGLLFLPTYSKALAV
jgi:hypothetical protein